MTEPTAIIFKYGSEWAPDSRDGIDIIEIGTDDRFQYENRTRGQVTTAAGRVAPGVWDEIIGNLNEAGFPAVPPHNIPPGGNLVELIVRTAHGDSAMQMHYFSALKFPGYRELLRRFNSWATWLRTTNTAESTPPGLIRTGV